MLSISGICSMSDHPNTIGVTGADSGVSQVCCLNKLETLIDVN